MEGSWPELLEMLVNGEIDLLSDVSFTPQRAEQMLFPSLPMGTEEYYLFVEPDVTGYTPGDYDCFSGKRVGVNKGSVQKGFFEKWIATYGVRAEVVELTCTELEAFDMLKTGELDGFVSLDAYGNAGTAVPEIRIGSSDFFFAVSRGDPELLKALDAALARIQDENRYYNQQMFQKYVSTSGANLFVGNEESAWLAGHGAIRVGYQDDYLSFCARDPRTGALTGALKDYLESAADCLGNARLDFEAVAYPSANAAMKALKSGEVDCMFPSNLSTSDSEALELVTTPSIMRAEIYALVRRGEQDDFAQRDAVTVAVEIDEPNYESVLMDNFGDWEKAYFPGVEACMEAVGDGRADCLLISNYQYNNLSRLCERYGLAPLSTGKDVEFNLAVNRGDKELYSILTRTATIVSDAAVNAALTYYSAEDARTSLVDLVLDNLPFVIGAAIAIAAMILLLIIQRRMIVVQRKAEESQRMVEDLNKQVYVDALTRVRNKGGFDNYVGELQARLEQGEATEVAVGVFDCNDLKLINDHYGHDKGNLYLKAACALICRVFQHSPVFRIGGDEFTVVLQNEDFQNREALVRQFEAAQESQSAAAKNRWEHISVATGIAVYDPEIDRALGDTLRRADQLMYENKRGLKKAR